MKSLEKFFPLIKFGAIVLFITDLWVFLYVNLLTFLNKTYPPLTPTGFIRSDVSPEPFEIPLYIALTTLFVGVVLIYHSYLKPRYIKKIMFSVPKIIFLPLFFVAVILFSFLFIKQIGIYPMSHDIYPYPQGESVTTNHFYLFLYLSVIFFISAESLILEKFVKLNKKIIAFFIFFILIIIAIATFEPRFPIVGLDYSLFIGPIWEIAHGKTIFTDVPSLYGFLPILLFSVLVKFHLLNLWYLPVLNWVLYIAEYFLCFIIIFKISRSLALSIIALFSFITLNYFSLFMLPATILQVGPYRWLPLIAAIFILLISKKVGAVQIIFFISLMVFWIIDVGIFLFMSYIFTISILVILKRLTFKDGFRSLFLLAIFSVFIISVIESLHLLLGFKFVDMTLLFAKIRLFAQAGFGMIPIPSKSYFWMTLLIYFASIVYFVNKKKTQHFDNVLLFSANISLFSAVYFVGRSHPHNLFHIALFVLLNFYILVSLLFEKLQVFRHRLLIIFMLFIVLILYPAFQRQEVLTKIIKQKIEKYKETDIFKPEAKEILKKQYDKDIDLVKREFPQEKVPLLSDDDTYILLLSNKTSYIDYNPQGLILTQSDVHDSLKTIINACPKKIVADCKLFGKCLNSYSFTDPFFTAVPILFNNLQKQCGLTYQATKCTNHLCIGQAK